MSFNQNKHIQKVYQIFREELVICLESLRYLHLENAEHTGEIHKPKNWGKISKRYQDNFYRALKLHLQPPTVTKEAKEVLTVESNLQRKITFDSEPLFPADTFLYPSQEILSIKTLQAVFQV